MTLFVRRIFDDPGDREAFAAIRRRLGSRRESTVEGLLREDEEWPDDALLCRFLIERPASVIGEASAVETFWTTTPELVLFEFNLLADEESTGAAEVVCNTIEETVARERPNCSLLGTRATEDQRERLAYLDQRGYRIVLRLRRSRLDVQAFDPSPYAHLPQRLEQEGIELTSLTHIQSEMTDWKVALRDLRYRIHQDVPMTESPRKPSMANFEKMVLQDPALDPETWRLARLATTGELVGISNLWINDAERKRLDTGLTGVLSDYRRRGIATALKVATIESAKRIGARWIDTHNEEDNPMFLLNLKLGFQERPARLELRRELV